MRTSLSERGSHVCETFNRCDLAMRSQSRNAEVIIIFLLGLFVACITDAYTLQLSIRVYYFVCGFVNRILILNYGFCT